MAFSCEGPPWRAQHHSTLLCSICCVCMRFCAVFMHPHMVLHKSVPTTSTCVPETPKTFCSPCWRSRTRFHRTHTIGMAGGKWLTDRLLMWCTYITSAHTPKAALFALLLFAFAAFAVRAPNPVPEMCQVNVLNVAKITPGHRSVGDLTKRLHCTVRSAIQMFARVFGLGLHQSLHLLLHRKHILFNPVVLQQQDPF